MDQHRLLQEEHQKHLRRNNNFAHSKAQCLGKRDKSFAGRIDFRAVEICSVINEREEFYTTSSCAGRCFLYRGHGIKSSHFLETTNKFERFRISHDVVRDAKRYFDLASLSTDPTGGGDPIRSIGQFEHGQQLSLATNQQSESEARKLPEAEDAETQQSNGDDGGKDRDVGEASSTVWLRFEPFILHVCCRSLSAASALMAAARPAFKNVGLTSWKDGKYLVAIWGDEGLDMPLCTPDGVPSFVGHQEWLQHMVNERHERNWSKIDRFVQSVRALPHQPTDLDGFADQDNDVRSPGLPRSYDVVGDVAIVHAWPEGKAPEDPESVGLALMHRNKGIKVCAVRTSSLQGTERAPGELTVVAGPKRDPLVTTHSEHGIKCVVDLNRTFFSPRMGPERLRLCQQVARGERVLVLFAGVGMEALQIAGRTEASRVVAVELNPVAVRCARNSHKMLSRNKAVKCVGAADRLEIVEGDVLEVLPGLERNSFDRILAPRPKEGSKDGDLGDGSGGAAFLHELLPVLKEDGGECHWYDFAADHEFPQCSRTKQTIVGACDLLGLGVEILHVANAGSVAKRQLRVCMDFRLRPKCTPQPLQDGVN